MNRLAVVAALGALSSLFDVVAEDTPWRGRGRSSRVPGARTAMPIGKPIIITPPLGLPPVPFPADNPPTAETVALGHRLFFEPMFSRDSSISCASCHDPKTGSSDARMVSLGVNEAPGKRQSMPVINAAYHLTQFWDGRALTLEAQAERPVADPGEMAHSLTGVVRRLSADPFYVDLFASAWGPGPITYEMVAKSIASYERTLLSGNSPFDRYYYGGDKKAMSPSAIRGLKLFMMNTLDSPNCVSCHIIGPKWATFTEVRFHNTGIAWNTKEKEFADIGRFALTGEGKDRGAFKVPTLRNIELTAPYMHDGSMNTLEQTVDFYFDGGRPNPHLSGVVPHGGIHDVPHEQQKQAKADLVAFMKALTGTMPPGAQPPARRQMRAGVTR